MNPLRVLVVAGDPLARAGLAGLVAEQEDLTVTGQVGADGDLPELLETDCRRLVGALFYSKGQTRWSAP